SDISEFSVSLEKRCPELFNGSVNVYTEFGRYYHANAGFTLSRIEETKRFEDGQTLVHHLGANMFVRESYEPGKWPHKMQIIDPDFTMKTDNEIPTDVGGPLCFGGDYMSKNTPLPEAEKGDYLVIMDTGANSLG